MASQEIFIDYDKPAFPKKKKKREKIHLNTYCAASIMEMGLWWNGGQRLGKGWEVIYSWLVNKIHSCLMLLRNLFFFLT